MSPSSTTEEDYFQGVVVNVNEEPGANFTTNPLVMMEKQDAAPGSEQPGYEPNTPSVKHEQINLFWIDQGRAIAQLEQCREV